MIVWASLRAHRVLQQYKRGAFIEHPSVASMLVVKLLEHQGDLDREAGSEAAKKALKAASAAKTTADSLKNDVGNLTARVKKLENP